MTADLLIKKRETNVALSTPSRTAGGRNSINARSVSPIYMSGSRNSTIHEAIGAPISFTDTTIGGGIISQIKHPIHI